MEIETLKKSHLKRNILIGVVVVAVISAIVLNFTRARYRVTESIPLVNGTINYTPYDLNIVALYIDGVEAETLDSNTNYTLDTTQSTCTYKDGTEIPNLTLSYDSTTKSFSITPYTTRGTKCTLYFDKYEPTAADTILAGKNIQTRSDFSTTYTTATTNTVFQTTDWKGTSYYFAGAPTDNWVYFGGYYWQIVRVNGDGSVRLIYNGSTTTRTGTNTLISTSQAFNTSYTASYYVGLSYSTTQHGIGNKSPVLTALDNWYTSSGLSNYSQYIDSSVGFCSDRNMTSGYTWSSRPSSTIYYSAYGRLAIAPTPSLACDSSDILAIPIGLITADEVALAGGVYGTNNTSYYLYNNQYYWTMSPYGFFSSGYATVFVMYSSGNLIDWDVSLTRGVRPVINLKADVTILSGNGTSSSPYIVE